MLILSPKSRSATVHMHLFICTQYSRLISHWSVLVSAWTTPSNSTLLYQYIRVFTTGWHSLGHGQSRVSWGSPKQMCPGPAMVSPIHTLFLVCVHPTPHLPYAVNCPQSRIKQKSKKYFHLWVCDHVDLDVSLRNISRKFLQLLNFRFWNIFLQS